MAWVLFGVFAVSSAAAGTAIVSLAISALVIFGAERAGRRK
jgi:hypothetical protein